MSRKNIPIQEYEDDYIDDDDYDIESNRNIQHRKLARQKLSMRRRIEELLEEKAYRDNDYF